MNKSGVARRFLAGILGGAALLAFPAGRASAQCTLVAPPLSFEPNPPGASRNGTNLSSGNQNDLLLYQAGGSPRMMMLEAFGYSLLDLSDPMNPVALVYDNMNFSGEVPSVGDGQSYVASIGVSVDGQRYGLSLNGNAKPEDGTVVGSGSGAGFNRITGGFAPRGAGGGVVIQHVGNRYIAYALLPFSNLAPRTLSIVDVTNLPGSFGPTNMTPETMAPGGFNLTLAGNNVVYLSGATIRILDASSPGPVGNIQSGFRLTTISSADLRGGTPNSFSAAVDPVDPAKLWVLAEVTFAGQPAPGWVLLSVKNGVPTPTGAPFQIQPAPGETWGIGNPSALIPAGGSLAALMWGKKSSMPVMYRLFSSSVAGWGTTNTSDVDPAQFPTFALRSTMRGFAGSGNSVYAYVPTGNSAYALSLSCVTVPAPPVNSLAVQYAACPGSGACALNPGDTVFVGTQLLVTPTAFGLHALTDWRFDFDWHPPAEDNVSLPRLKFPDLSSPGSGPNPPATIALYGPCDPRAGGTPSSGAGCWSSVSGDFPANAPAGTTSSLSLAFEAANDLGNGNTTTFPIAWKIPAVRLQSPNILLGQPVQSASDGTPLSTGYKWYFGTTPTSLTLSSCTGASCAPPPPFDAKGTYYYWLTVPYPTGYTSPDCGSPCTRNLGSFAVTDVALAFSGIANSVVAGGAVTATDGSSVAPGVTSCGGGLQYSLCDASAGPCAAGSWQPLALGSPLGGGGAASIPLGSTAGTYWLRIRYSYTTTVSCASPLVTSWTPSVAGVSDNTAWPIAVTAAPPFIDARVNGANPCVGAGGACAGGIPANIGDTITVNAILNGRIDSSPPLATLWSFGPSASPASCAGTGCQGTAFHFTGAGTFTITLAGYAVGAGATFVVAAPPVVASNGGPVCAGSPLPLFASPDISGATFSWTGPGAFTSTLQNPVVPAAAATTGTYTVVRTFGGQTSTASTSGVVNPPPLVPTAGNNGPLCAGQTLALTAATVAGATYAWTGPNGFTSALQNPSLPGATAAATGTYVVTATVNRCSSAASTGVTVNAPPPAPAAGNNGPLCGGGTLALTAATIANATWAWTGPNGFTSALQNPTIPNATAAAGGVYSVTATVNGCTGPAGSTTAVVSGASASITAPSRICLAAGNTGTASVPDAGGGATYAWTIANGAITGGQGTASISFSIAGAGTATLGVTVTAGACASTGSATILVQAQCGGLSTLAPCRAVDTRNASGPFGGPRVPANGLRSFNLLSSACGIPSTAKAVSANLTVVSPTAPGALHVYPGDLGVAPLATAISFSSGKTRANNAILRLATDGSGTVAVQSESGGPFDLVIDVNGYFE